jgi:hypothetical protein
VRIGDRAVRVCVSHYVCVTRALDTIYIQEVCKVRFEEGSRIEAASQRIVEPEPTS